MQQPVLGNKSIDFPSEVSRINFYIHVVLSNLEWAHAGPFMIQNPRLRRPDYPCGDFSPPHPSSLSKNGKTVYKKQFPPYGGFKFRGLENISTPVNH